MAGASQAKGILDSGAPHAPEDAFVRVVRGIDKGLAKVEEILLTLVLLFLVCLGVYQVVKPGAAWPRETIHYCVLFIGMVAGALATQSDRLFNIDMFSRLFGQRGKLVIRIVAAAFTIGICWIIYKSAMVFRDTVLATEVEEDGLAAINPTLGVLPLPYGALLIATHLFLHSVIDVYYLVTNKPSPDVAEMAPKA